MTVHKLVIWPNSKLRKQSEEVTEFDAKLRQLVIDLHETMRRFDGVGTLPDATGLAAPQIGVHKRIFVYKLDGEQTCMINPKILEKEGEELQSEGCLSFPSIFVTIKRATKIFVEFQDVDGNVNRIKTDGFTARCIQHEFDHLNGITLADNLSRIKKDVLARKMKKAQKRVTATQKRLDKLSQESIFTEM